MTIKRCLPDGTEISFELTSQELYDAYCEQQHLFDCEDVGGKLEYLAWSSHLADDYGLTYREARGHLDEIAHEKRRLMDKYDLAWDAAVDDAISHVLSELTNR